MSVWLCSVMEWNSCLVLFFLEEEWHCFLAFHYKESLTYAVWLQTWKDHSLPDLFDVSVSVRHWTLKPVDSKTWLKKNKKGNPSKLDYPTPPWATFCFLLCLKNWGFYSQDYSLDFEPIFYLSCFSGSLTSPCLLNSSSQLKCMPNLPS